MGSAKEKKDICPPGHVPLAGMNRDQVAEAFGVNVRTINRWVAAGMPRPPSGFSLPECISWFAAQDGCGKVQAKGPGKGKKDQGGETTDKSPWLEAYRRERARMARMERMKMSGSLLPKDEVVRQFTDRAFEFGRALLTLGRRFSAKVAAKCKATVREVEAIHEKEARKVLEDYARPIEIKEE